MNFDPTTILFSAVLTLILIGMTLKTLIKDAPRGTTGYWWISAFLLTAFGFICFSVRAEPHSTLRIMTNVAFLTGYACCYNGSRTLGGRPPLVWPVVSAVIFWPLFIGIWAPDLEARSAVFSIIVCLYTVASGVEFAYRASAHERSRFIAAILCALHATFYLARAILGPTFGLADENEETVIATSGAIIALEALPFCALLAILVISISLEQTANREKAIANTDYLTGIGNRRAFEAAMTAVIDEDNGRREHTLLLMDLDNFKAVNDQLGHEVGDTLLKSFTQIISAHLPEPSLFWRLGGDEFGALLRDKKADEIDALKDELRTAVQISTSIADITQDACVSVSIGSVRIEADRSLTQILRDGDAALYRNKTLRRQRC